MKWPSLAPRPAAARKTIRKGTTMSNIQELLDGLMEQDGAKAACVVDSASGMILGRAGSGIDLDIAAAGNTDVVRAKIKTMRALGLLGSMEDALMTLEDLYEIIRPVKANRAMFIYFLLDRAQGNLAMARYRVAEIDNKMVI